MTQANKQHSSPEWNPKGIGDPKRVDGFDLARAFAVFGMIVVNFKIVMDAESAGPAWLVWSLGLLDGRAAATFVILAGVGISLMSARARERGDSAAVARDRGTLFRRAIFLFVLGLMYTPLWPADILHFYGVYIALALFFLTTSMQRLLGAAAALTLIFMALLLFLDYEAGWDWHTLSYQGFWTPSGLLRHLFFNGFHPVIPWLAFMLVGMALGRIDLTDGKMRARVLQWSLPAAVLAEAASWGLRQGLGSTDLFGAKKGNLLALIETNPMPPTMLYMVAAAGTAVTVVVLCVGLGMRFRDSKWLRPFVATGQLALTLYVAHVVVGMGLLEAANRLKDQSLVFALSAASIFCVISVTFATLWKARFRHGPLEWVMRLATNPKA
ncbi:MAG: DUF418 domain-containing protein [Acidobacteria bacterium]|nr:DUF418 domain-containing protein [Acidobacteriota bacterium]